MTKIESEEYSNMSIESSLCFALDAAALEVRGQFDQLQYCELKKAIVLNDMLLVEDDAPAIGRPQGAEDRSWFEKLQEGGDGAQRSGPG